ncbi:DNA repair protein XRCC4 isoform X4 [Mobula hypostoma]|uniref:DNA repair protein XRCC4 isoform X4 n=1 Tax=Mobula hypostoma TaxID=723540 RepID=UPI002FC2D80D
MEIHICRIWPLTTPDTVHYLKIGWDEDLGNGFTITLCNGEQAWSGNVSSDQITIEASEAEMDREKYVEELRCALISRDEKTNRYSFDFIKDSEREVFHFSYEKVSQDISFRLGSVELKEVSSTTDIIKELIDIVLQSNTELRSRNNSLQQENKRLLSERNSGLEQLEEYVKAKEGLEQDLYSRFILVLNAKKAKIRQLQEHLKRVREQTEAGSQSRSAAATSQETLLTEECNTDEEHGSHSSTSRSLAQTSKSVTGLLRNF